MNLRESKRLLQAFKKRNPDIIVSDINLTKTKTTPLLEDAKSLGIETLDGTVMVVYQ